MQRTFLPSPTSHVPQTQFWQLYREAFSPTTSSAKVVSPLLSATELINNVSQVFSGAQASLVDNVFVMKGIKVRGGSKGLSFIRLFCDFKVQVPNLIPPHC